MFTCKSHSVTRRTVHEISQIVWTVASILINSTVSIPCIEPPAIVRIPRWCIEPLKIVSTEHPSLVPTKGKPFVRHHPSNITWLATHHHQCCTTNNSRSSSKGGENTLTDTLTFKLWIVSSSRFGHRSPQDFFIHTDRRLNPWIWPYANIGNSKYAKCDMS